MPLVEKPLAPARESATNGFPREKTAMILKFGFSAALLLAAAPVLAQPPAGGTAPAGGAAAAQPAQPAQPSPAAVNAIQTAAQAFGTCVSSGVQSVPASATPEAGAATVLGGCATQRQALVQAVESMIATMPADQQAAAHAQMASQLGSVQGQIADGIRQQRAAAAAPATPAPTTPTTPAAPH
jgi:hypothetical protein